MSHTDAIIQSLRGHPDRRIWRSDLAGEQISQDRMRAIADAVLEHAQGLQAEAHAAALMALNEARQVVAPASFAGLRLAKVREYLQPGPEPMPAPTPAGRPLELAPSADLVECVHHHQGRWPAQLTSGVMFWRGERIERTAFHAYAVAAGLVNP